MENNETSIRAHILDSSGSIFFSSLVPEDFLFLERCSSNNELFSQASGKKIRHGKIEKPYGLVYLITDGKDVVRSSRLFLEKQQIFVELMPKISEVGEKIFSEIQHDIPKIHSHNIQEIFSLIPQDGFQKAKSAEEQISFIKKLINNNQEKAARTLLKIIKNNSSISNEFTILDAKYSGEYIKQFAPASIHKVLFNVLVNYFVDFKDLRIQVDLGKSEDLVNIDYVAFTGALVPFFDNITKYILPDTKLRISFDSLGSEIIVGFSMLSLQIKGSEVASILQEGFRGEMAKKSGKTGKGLGFSNIKKLLQISNARIEINPNMDISERKQINGLQYEYNIFKIFVNKKC